MEETAYEREAGTCAFGLTVGDIEAFLFEEFPAQHCEPWDMCGLLVGDASTPVTRVAVALDPTSTTIDQAAACGCNVLVTHHPAYLQAPERIIDMAHGGTEPAARIIKALVQGVSLVAMHTNLDRSQAAKAHLAGMLGMRVSHDHLLQQPDGLPCFGCVAVPEDGAAITLQQLADTCATAYGQHPRVWGDPSRELHTVGIYNGSSSSMARDIVEQNVDCVVTGEMSYHNASELVSCGVSLIELGHDASELPLRACLCDALARHGVAGDMVEMIDPDVFWWQPGMVKL